MPRRGFVPRREVAPDPIYRSTLLQRLINKVMERGKKGKAVPSDRHNATSLSLRGLLQTM